MTATNMYSNFGQISVASGVVPPAILSMMLCSSQVVYQISIMLRIALSSLATKIVEALATREQAEDHQFCYLLYCSTSHNHPIHCKAIIVEALASREQAEDHQFCHL